MPKSRPSGPSSKASAGSGYGAITPSSRWRKTVSEAEREHGQKPPVIEIVKMERQ